MTKTKILLISSAVVLALAFNANAASPQQNNLEVQKALRNLQQGLQKPKGNLQIVVAPDKQIKPATVNAVVYRPHIIQPQMPQAVINAIIVSPNNVLLKQEGTIYYKISQLQRQLVIDIINPVYDIGTQNYHPENTGDISNAVIAYHTNRNLYGYPYLRIAVYLNKHSLYSVGSINGNFVVSFGNSIPMDSVPNMPVATNSNIQPIQLELLQKINQLEKQITTIKASQKQEAMPTSANNSSLYNDFKKAQSPIQSAHTIDISLQNISCIVSPYPIKKVIFSKEDSLQLQVVGNQVFVKILPLKILEPDGTYKYKYSNKPRDIYIVTEAKTYSLNLVPKNTPAVTYTLIQSMPTQNTTQLEGLQQNLNQKQLEYAKDQLPQSDFTEPQNSYVGALMQDIKETYIGKTPSGFVLNPFSFEKEYSQLTIEGKYKFISSNAIIYAYKLIANKDLNIDPSQFVWLVAKPMAATVIEPDLKAGQSTMLYIIGGK